MRACPTGIWPQFQTIQEKGVTILNSKACDKIYHKISKVPKMVRIVDSKMVCAEDFDREQFCYVSTSLLALSPPGALARSGVGVQGGQAQRGGMGDQRERWEMKVGEEEEVGWRTPLREVSWVWTSRAPVSYVTPWVGGVGAVGEMWCEVTVLVLELGRISLWPHLAPLILLVSRLSPQEISGEPLACSVDTMWYLVGLVSWGPGCSKSEAPPIYLQVTSYQRWIWERVSGQDLPAPSRALLLVLSLPLGLLSAL